MKVLLSTLVLALMAMNVHAQEPGTRPTNEDPKKASKVPSEKKAAQMQADQRWRYERIRLEVFADPFDEDKVHAYMASLPKDGDLYVVEGDLLLTAQELRAYVVTKSQAARPVDRNPELIVNVHAGERDFYKDVAQRNLTYAVDRQSFPTSEQYQEVVKNMGLSGKDWQDACPDCKVQFTHVEEADLLPSHERVNFVVRYRDVGGAYIAAAFFPHDGPSRRFLNVDPSYFKTSFDRVGVFRHELGHVIGYRHEHTRDVPGCYFEDKQWLPLTDYDPRSVMHYYCGGGGSLRLELTDFDRQGHRKLYGLTGIGQTNSDENRLRVRFEGADINTSPARVLQTLAGLKLLGTQTYKVTAPGETLKSIYQKTLQLPVYTPSLQSFALKFNQGKAANKALKVGTEVVYPDVKFTSFEKLVLLDLTSMEDRRTYKALKAAWPKELANERSLDKKSVALILNGLELSLSFGSAAQVRSARSALNSAKKTYKADYLVLTPMKSTSAAKKSAPYFSYFGGAAAESVLTAPAVAPIPDAPRRTAEQFYSDYLGSGKNLDAGQEGDLSLSLSELDPTLEFPEYCNADCTADCKKDCPDCEKKCMECKEKCPEIILFDTPVFTHQDMGRAVENTTGQPSDSPIDSQRKQMLIIEGVGTGINNSQHGTHLAGIIASQPNGFGLVGVHPRARIYSMDWTKQQHKPEEVRDLITSRVDDFVHNRAGLPIFVFATEWSYQDAEFDSDNARFDTDQDFPSPWRILASSIQDSRPLIITAAGQPETQQEQPKPLSRRTPKGPRNLGDEQYVIVVTAYDNKNTAGGIKLWPRAHFLQDTAKLVHVAAPGIDILSTVPNTSSDKAAHYGIGTGTSQATAFVAGVVSYMVSAWPSFYKHAYLVKTRLQVTSNPYGISKSDRRLLAAGVVDFNLAMHNPNKHWFESKTNGNALAEISDFKWLVDTITLTDGVNNIGPIQTKEIYRIIYKDDICYIYGAGKKNGEVVRYGPAKMVNAADLQGRELFELKMPGATQSKKYALSEVSDLILSGLVKYDPGLLRGLLR